MNKEQVKEEYNKYCNAEGKITTQKKKCKKCGYEMLRAYKQDICYSCRQTGADNSNWKGNEVKYEGIHIWIRGHKSKPERCERCGRITNELDCANINGVYNRDLKNYEYLCRKCHMAGDGRIKNLLKGIIKGIHIRDKKNGRFTRRNEKETRTNSKCGGWVEI